MIITKAKGTQILETPHKIDVRRLYDNEHAQVSHMTLQAGEALKPHITPVDVFFYILEGTVDVLVGDEKISVDAESLVESPKDIVHCLYNNSDSIVRLLVVKTPRPTKKTIMI